MISSMKTVKMYCWENYFDELIKVARAAEMSKIWLSRCFQAILTSIFTSGSKQIIFASFLVLMQTTTVANFSGNDFKIYLLYNGRNSLVPNRQINTFFFKAASSSSDMPSFDNSENVCMCRRPRDDLLQFFRTSASIRYREFVTLLW